jgi:D-beta-D-heptose 7-phosphate kinase/D-beta-D-heptose 1-phosphate adenosyltransferase
VRTIAIAGKFDPLHEGHIDHIRKAKKLGDYLIVITHRDDVIVRVKGFCYQTLTVRVRRLYAQPEVNLVVVSCDEDGTVYNTLRILHPDVFAKGGDRTPENMPESEKLVCANIGCEIIYGIGDLLNSSSKIAREVKCGSF